VLKFSLGLPTTRCTVYNCDALILTFLLYGVRCRGYIFQDIGFHSDAGKATCCAHCRLLLLLLLHGFCAKQIVGDCIHGFYVACWTEDFFHVRCLFPSDPCFTTPLLILLRCDPTRPPPPRRVRGVQQGPAAAHLLPDGPDHVRLPAAPLRHPHARHPLWVRFLYFIFFFHSSVLLVDENWIAHCTICSRVSNWS
jgi:hypothetical protein